MKLNSHIVDLSLDELSTLQIALVIATGAVLNEMQTNGLPVIQQHRERYDRLMMVQAKISSIFAAALAANTKPKKRNKMSEEVGKLMQEARDHGHKITTAIASHIESIRKIAQCKDEKTSMLGIVTLALFMMEVQNALEKAKWIMEMAHNQIEKKEKVENA